MLVSDNMWAHVREEFPKSMWKHVEEEFLKIFVFEFPNSKWKRTLVLVDSIFAKLCEENFPACPTEESADEDLDCSEEGTALQNTLESYKQMHGWIGSNVSIEHPAVLKLKKCVQEEGGVEEVDSEMVI